MCDIFNIRLKIENQHSPGEIVFVKVLIIGGNEFFILFDFLSLEIDISKHFYAQDIWRISLHPTHRDDVRIRTHPAPVPQTRWTLGGHGVPDDADVHFLPPVAAISICLETAQGKYNNQPKNCRIVYLKS